MARRNRTNGRFTKQTTRRRSRRSKALSITNTAEQLLVANAITTGVFGSDLYTFLTKGYGTGGHIGEYTTSITLPDFFERIIEGGSTGMVNSRYPKTMASIKANLKRDGGKMVAQVILYPMLFRAAKKVLAKPLIRPTNRLLKQAGLSGSVKV